MYKIEKNIPMPLIRGFRMYPYREMKVGNSIFIPDSDVPPSGAYPAPHYFAKRNPEYKFTVRKVEGGFRIWRIPVE